MTYRRTASRLIPPAGTDDKRYIAEMMRNIVFGRLDWGGEVTLATSLSTTTLLDTRIDINKVVQFFPSTANAAAAITSTYIKDADYTSGQAVITHANNGQSDRVFRYIVMG